MAKGCAQPTELNRHTQTGTSNAGQWVNVGATRGSPRGMPKGLYRHRLPRRMTSGIKPCEVCRMAYAGAYVAGQGACQDRGGRVLERAGSMPERARPVKLQTKEAYVALLCSDRHGSPGWLRIAKGQTSAGKEPMPDRYPFRVRAGWYRRRTTEGQEVFSPH